MTGLTNEQVQERIAEGKVNANENPNTRTYKQIILENTQSKRKAIMAISARQLLIRYQPAPLKTDQNTG